MYKLLKSKLKERKEPINVAIAGSGWLGGGLARELYRIDGIEPKVLIDLIPEKAVSVYSELGIDQNDVILVSKSSDLDKSKALQKYVVLPNVKWINDLDNIDLVYDATGDIIDGIVIAQICFDKKIPLISANFELDSLIGLRISNLAKENGVFYSNSDGDQPGVLARMLEEVSSWGFKPKIVGNCKGFIDLHQDPIGVKPFVPNHQDLHKVCGMADGTKQSIEMATLGNAFGFYPLKRGMYGPTTSKHELVKTFDELVDLKSLTDTHVDYVLGINGVDQGAGVFIVAHRDGPHIKEDLKFLKKGEGPNYLFFRDHHLCHFETAACIAEAVLFNTPLFYAKGRYIDVMSVAKRDLSPGQKIDGIGGFDCYGLVERADIVADERFLPVGLAEYATVTKKIRKDEPISYDMVDLSENTVVTMRHEQEQLPIP